MADAKTEGLNALGLRVELNDALVAAARQRGLKRREHEDYVSSVVRAHLFYGREEAIRRAMELAKISTPVLFPGGKDHGGSQRVLKAYQSYLRASDAAIREACENGRSTDLAAHALNPSTRTLLRNYGEAVRRINSGEIDGLKATINDDCQRFLKWEGSSLVLRLFVDWHHGHRPVGPYFGDDAADGYHPGASSHGPTDTEAIDDAWGIGQ